ncbi:MAG: hypothetical protein KF763_10050 [Cyclobacteriaceae bacterium]|nr:hypothetical protein [Cyclobacteriaceae bacterium]
MRNVTFRTLSSMLLLVLISCDPAFEYYVEAKENDISLEIHPALESVYCPDVKELCDFATTHKINDVPNGSVYRVKRGERFSIYGGVGTQGSVSGFPFELLKIIQGSDTLLLKDKNEILGKFIKEEGTNRYRLSLKP